MKKSDKEWKEELNPEAYKVLRQKGTESPFTGEYDDHFEKGIYRCAGCSERIFESGEKFNAGCGWPSFSLPKSEDSIREVLDKSHGMIRTEVTCSNCGGHLGHVFNDGPPPSGLRYCINSASLKFENE